MIGAVICPRCGGPGNDPEAPDEECSACQGAGAIDDPTEDDEETATA